MTTIYTNAEMDDSARRRRLYEGDLFVYTPTKNTVEFCNFAQEMIREAFGSVDPETAQYNLSVDEYIEILKNLKPRFIHHPESKQFLRKILSDLRCDLQDIYFDVPRLRSSTSDEYLTTGIAYAWHPHRDTWYSAPSTQINIWLPVFDIQGSNTIAFHPSYFDEVVPNDSDRYNYYEWNSKFRGAAASQVGKDSRPLPGPDHQLESSSSIGLVCPAGGVILFSGAQLHSSVPNTSGRTRFSIDFRTVSMSDTLSGIGAPTGDVRCSGSSIRDFIRAGDFSEMPENVIVTMSDGTEHMGDLKFQPI